ncbi:MAG: AI-2E family transporter [Chromatiaceae bacterium]|nr:MAG: AI-2E family transporter [Chromatiaceae bacterium]
MNPVLAGFTPPARGLLVAAAVALVVWITKLAAPILVPLLLAVFVAVIAMPGLRWLRSRGVPKWVALGIVLFVLLDIGSLLALLFTGALEGFRESLPTYQERFLLLSAEIGERLERVGVGGSQEAIPDLLDPAKVGMAVRLILSNASGFFATGLLVLLAVAFILLEAGSFMPKLRAAFRLEAAGEARLHGLLEAIRRYMLIKSLSSLAVAACVWMWLWLLGIDFAILWAIIAFLFNFVPVVGNIVMMLPAALMAAVQTDLPTTMLVIAGYLVINTIIGNVIEPRIMGRGLGISTLVVFVGLLFWGWLLGTVGMFLAVPLTKALIVALEASPHTRPIAILLGPEVSPAPIAAEEESPSPV